MRNGTVNCMYFEGNFAHEAGDDIFTSSLIPCIRSGSNGSTDTSIDARKKVFRATPPFYYSDNLTNSSIVTGAAEIKFIDKVNVSRDDLHISVYPGQLFNLTTKMEPLDELEALSKVPFFATTNVSNFTFPAVKVDPNNEYTTRYLQFLASKNCNTGLGLCDASIEAQLQAVPEPPLLFSFNVSLSECPPGSWVSFPNNATEGQCECARNGTSDGYLKGIICYKRGSDLSIFRQASVWYGEQEINKLHSRNISITAPCSIYCPPTRSNFNLIPLNQTDPTSGICASQSRGILCGTCVHGIVITSNTFKCCTLEERQAISAAGAWVAWIAIQLVLTTVIVAVILLSGCDVIGGTLCSYVFFSQVVLELNLHGCTSGTTLSVIENIERSYAIWSLRFRWLLPYVNLCMPSIDNTLEALAIDYAFAIYPFVLIAIAWIIAHCQEKGWCCCCLGVCGKIKDCFGWLKRKVKCCDIFLRWFRGRVSLAHGIATCLILTYGNLLMVSFFILAPVQLSVPHGYGHHPNDIEGGSLRSLYNGDFAYFGFPHYLYGTGAILVVGIFGVIPPLFLMSYPWLPQFLKWCNKCKCSLVLGKKMEGWYEKRFAHHFLEMFQGHYKSSHCYFAGMWLVYRLVLHAINVFTPDCATSFTVQIIFGVIFLLLHSILQPNKERKHNVLDSLFLANIILLSTLGLVFWSSNGQGSGTNAITAAMAIFLILPHLYFLAVVIIYIIYIWRYCHKEQDPHDQQPLLNFGSDAVMCCIAGGPIRAPINQADSTDFEENSSRNVTEANLALSYYAFDERNGRASDRNMN